MSLVSAICLVYFNLFLVVLKYRSVNSEIGQPGDISQNPKRFALSKPTNLNRLPDSLEKEEITIKQMLLVNV